MALGKGNLQIGGPTMQRHVGTRHAIHRFRQAAYRRMHREPRSDAPPERFRAAMHVRLGDVAEPKMKRYKWKYAAPPYFVAAGALLAQALPPRCVSLTIFTDQPQHRDIGTIQNQLRARHNLTSRVAAKSERAATERQATDFHKMAAAHVLIVSKSGFSRLAAVLSRAVGIAPVLGPNPLTGLRGMVSVEVPRLVADPAQYVAEMVRALQELWPQKYAACLKSQP